MSKLINKSESVLAVIDVQKAFVPTIASYDQMLSKISLLLKAAKHLDVPVLVSEQYPKGLGHTVDEISEQIEDMRAIEKSHFACPAEPLWRERLVSLDRSQLIITGIEAHVCVLQTVLDLCQSGRKIFVVADAISSRSEQDKKIAIDRMWQAGAHMVSAEMVFFEWLEKSGTPEFKELSTLLKN